jgi:hypothetical protein
MHTEECKKNAQNLVITASDFKSIRVTIGINENLLDEYSKFKQEKQMLKCDLNKGIDDAIFNFDYRACKVILNKAYQPGNKYKTVYNLFNLEYNVY